MKLSPVALIDKKLNPYYLIILLTVLSRIFWSLFVDFDSIKANEEGDSVFYLQMAQNILDFGVYGIGNEPEYYRAPLYSYFLALCSFIRGSWLINILLVQNLISIITSLTVFKLLRGFLERRVLLTWLILWTCGPASSLQDFKIIQESLYTNLLILAVTLSIILSFKYKIINILLLGICIGLTCWIREIYLLMPISIAASFFILKGLSYKVVKMISILSLCILLTISPWIYRNYKITNGEVFMSKGTSGATLFGGTWLSSRKVNDNWKRGIDLPPEALGDNSNPELLIEAIKTGDNKALSDEAIRRIKRQPFSVISTWLKRSPWMWIGTRSDLTPLTLQRGSISWLIFKASLWVFNILVISCGLLGMFTLGLRKNFLLMPSSFIFYNYLIYLPFYNIETRYSHPSLIWLLLFATLLIYEKYPYIGKIFRTLRRVSKV